MGVKPYTLHLGNMFEVLDTLEPNSIDAVVTDPPYEINFMNKGWDNTGIVFQKETWEKVLRVLKPGGHILAFNHSRTFHRMAVAIEDAGFQIRDTILWLYGSGFPKSQNIAKAIDKQSGFEGAIIGKEKIDVGIQNGSMHANRTSKIEERNIKELSTEAKQWEGWGSALKPSYEPIILARKPLDGTIADNVLKHGVGGLNIDGCRVGTEDKMTPRNNKVGQNGVFNASGGYVEPNELGRFPANTIHDGSDEVVDLFPTKPHGGDGGSLDTQNVGWGFKRMSSTIEDNGGSAARFFYTAKASKKDRDEGLDEFENKQMYKNTREGNSFDIFVKRNEYGKPLNPPRRNIHPTVKPTT